MAARLTTRNSIVDVQFSRLSHSVTVNGKEKVVLEDLSGGFEHGKLHAIMGPSGAGKSSLLNVLAGLNNVAGGEITLNGETYGVKACSEVVTPIRSYLMQECFLLPELTVKETIRFACAFNRIVDDRREIKKIVSYVLDRINLQPCANRRISALSGGQRKRAAIASELINYKPLLFLDEPLTGLDSSSTYRMVEFLKEIASQGCNIITVVHQPSSRLFALFDTVTILGSHGRLAYSGPCSSLVRSIYCLTGKPCPPSVNPFEFLFSGNIIELMIQCSSKQRHLALQKVPLEVTKTPLRWSCFEGDSETSKEKEPQPTVQPPRRRCCPTAVIRQLCEETQPSSLKKFALLFKRTVIQSRRNNAFFIGRIIAYVVTMVFVGLVYQFVGSDGKTWQFNGAFLFTLTTFFVVGVSIVTIVSSPIHLNVLVRENINGWYSFSAFFWCRTIIEATFNTILAVGSSSVMWIMSSQIQSSASAVGMVALVASLISIAVHHFSFILAMFAEVKALTQLPFAFIMLHTLFGGYFIPLNAMPVWIFWLRYIDTASFGFTSIMKVAYTTSAMGNVSGLHIPCKDVDPNCIGYSDGAKILNFWGIDFVSEPIWLDLLILCVHLFVFMLLHWLLLMPYLSRAQRAIARI